MHDLDLLKGPRVVGTKQTLRVLENGTAKVLYVAKNAQKQVTLRVIELAESKSIPIVYIETMEELAQACDVEVKTATAALIT
ncbi:MAG: 50S ribosomal protein L7ae-like protein [Firmicutes bacterium HGW-Firmicutes-7]|nr:MAG: 50S ribosomal protein L7ae-like protein [Firmicutes bacterium HGW-Firmicutes-7]